MKKFKELVSSPNKIIIPSYQRAYAWGEDQIIQFVKDLQEIDGKTYYYGHFIIEENKSSQTYEIIDGQQRITTFVLFILSAKKVLDNFDMSAYEHFILNNFETTSYDHDNFKNLAESIINNKPLVINQETKTSSFIRIEKAIDYFEKYFAANKINDITNLIDTLVNADISTHIVNEKSVAVQIFELQNSRGIKLDLIEKVKARLMKELYLYGDAKHVKSQINQIQNNFSEVYRLEEKITANSFRGEVSLENILLHHLRVIDDGAKLLKSTKELHLRLNEPSYGNIEKNILSYLSAQLLAKTEKEKKVEYILNLCNLFEKSVHFISETLVEKDAMSPLIGDCIILDKNHSLELYLILLHLDKLDDLDLEKWELFLYTRNFHLKYYNKKGDRDKFYVLFARIIKNDDLPNEDNKLNSILDNYLDYGFRGHGDGYKLQEVFQHYITTNEKKIKNNAFNFNPWKEKMTYLLYKYEISLDANCRPNLREVFNNKKTLDHILPQNWQIDWLINSDEFEKKKLKDSMDNLINGIGNLLIVTQSENSSLSDKAPFNKTYKNSSFGSYKRFEESKSTWENPNKWEGLISNRSKEIYDFLLNYFSNP